MRWICLGIILFVGLPLLAAGCRRDEPPPSHQEDLGDASQPLLPTSPTWKDDRVAGGTAEFQPLREPKLDENPAPKPGGAEEEGAAPSGDLQAELVGLAKEHNDALAGGSAAEVSDFYVEAQIQPVEAAVTALAAARDKLRELAAAMPEKKDDIERLAQLISPDSVLKLDVSGVQAKGEEEASGTLAPGAALALLPGAPAGDDLPHEITFRLGENDWYIDSPVVAIVGQATGPLGEIVTALDALIADAKAGSAKGADLAARAPVVAQMLEQMPPAGEAPAEGDAAAPEKDGEGEGAPAEKPDDAEPEGDGTAGPG